jgi:hypothetical protein
MLHLDVSKVDRVLHVAVCLLLLVCHRGSCARAQSLQATPQRASAGGAGGAGSRFRRVGMGRSSIV